MPKPTIRTRTIRLASSLPKGSKERRALLELLASDKVAANTNALRQKAEAIFEAEDMEEGDRDYGWSLREGYVGRGMVGHGTTPDRVSALAFDVASRSAGPQSEIGKGLGKLGFHADNMGMGWIYYLR
jgi:hypothetical protein